MNVTANNAAIEAEFKNSHLNLMILSELRQGYRVFTSDGSIRVKTQSIMDPFMRYYTKETRTHNVSTILAKLSVAYALIDTLMAMVYSYVTSCKSQMINRSGGSPPESTHLLDENNSSTTSPPRPHSMLHAHPKRFQQVYQQHMSTVNGGGGVGNNGSSMSGAVPSSPPKECAHSLSLTSVAGRVSSYSYQSGCVGTSSSPSCYHDRMNIILPVKYLRQLKDALYKCAGGDNADCGMECLLSTYSDDIAVCQQIRQMIMIMREKLSEISKILAIVDANADLFNVI